MSLEARYRRLLRWYPRHARESDGEVIIGTLLDSAEADGRRRPTASEAWELRTTGLGERFTLRASTGAATAALVFALCGLATMLGGGWLPLALTAALAPALLTFAALALLRHRRLITPRRTVLAFCVALPAWGLAWLATLSWSVGFDEADAGGPRSALGVAFVPLFFLGWFVGGSALIVTVTGVLRALPVVVRWAAAVAAAGIAPPVIGVTTVTPLAPAVVAVILLVLVGLMQRGTEPRPRPVPASAVSASVKRRVMIVASGALILSTVASAYALTGSHWGSGVDATRAMQIGITGGQLTMVPLLFCLGWIGAARRREREMSLWAMLLTLCAGLIAVAVDAVARITPSGDVPVVGMALIATGLALLVARVLPFEGGLRAAIGIAAGLVLTLPAWGAVMMIGFAAPLVAASLAIWAARAPHVRAAVVA